MTATATKTSTYRAALAATKTTSTMQLSDAEHMALFLEASAQLLLGAVSPQLIWQGAQAKGLSTRQLAELIHRDPNAARDLMWI